MNPFATLEAVCANAVERAFAAAFPSPLEPVQVARKLVAAFEQGPADARRAGRRFVVQLNPADYARFEGEGAYLTQFWATMLGRLGEREGLNPRRPPQVIMAPLAQVAAGTVGIDIETLPDPLQLALRVRKGIPPGARLALRDSVVVGRDPSCNLALGDPRVSRRHLQIVAGLDEVRFVDLDSANGVFLNGERASAGQLRGGDLLKLGDTELAIEPDDRAEASA